MISLKKHFYFINNYTSTSELKLDIFDIGSRFIKNELCFVDFQVNKIFIINKWISFEQF